MIKISKIKNGLLHPSKTIRYFALGKEKFKDGERIIRSSKYLDYYNKTKEYNKTNSKHFLYFDLCKRILSDSISDESFRKKFFENPSDINSLEISNVLQKEIDPKILVGAGWAKKRAHTMIGLMRLENLQFCVEEVIRNNIPGDLMETGVWRGGATILMRIILKKYGIENKLVYAADSFEGLPEPDIKKFPEDVGDKHYDMNELNVGLEEVKNNFQMYGTLDNNVKFIKGYFEDTLKNIPIEKLSLLRLDGDMYGSTWTVLENLYEKLSKGGYLIVDDYYLKACQKAIHDFRNLKNIKEPIMPIDSSGIYWKKE